MAIQRMRNYANNVSSRNVLLHLTSPPLHRVDVNVPHFRLSRCLQMVTQPPFPFPYLEAFSRGLSPVAIGEGMSILELHDAYSHVFFSRRAPRKRHLDAYSRALASKPDVFAAGLRDLLGSTGGTGWDVHACTGVSFNQELFASLCEDQNVKLFSFTDYLSRPDAWVLPVERAFMNETVQYGARATRDISRSEVVCEYLGSLVVDDDVFRKREEWYAMRGLPFGCYRLELESKAISRSSAWDCYRSYDGTTLTVNDNPGLWLNSANTQESPEHFLDPALDSYSPGSQNCVLRYASEAGKLRLYILATKDIPLGRECIHQYGNKNLVAR